MSISRVQSSSPSSLSARCLGRSRHPIHGALGRQLVSPSRRLALGREESDRPLDTVGPASKSIAPAFRRQSDKHPDISFYRVDICDQQDVAMDSGVKLAPTFRFFRDQKQVGEYVGSHPAELEVRHTGQSVGCSDASADKFEFVCSQRKLAAFAGSDKQ